MGKIGQNNRKPLPLSSRCFGLCAEFQDVGGFGSRIGLKVMLLKRPGPPTAARRAPSL